MSSKVAVELHSVLDWTSKTELNTELDTEILELDSDINNIKVLVVEDIPNQLLMKTLLDDFDLKRDIAENGEIAIEN
jgi:hypothetical protein